MGKIRSTEFFQTKICDNKVTFRFYHLFISLRQLDHWSNCHRFPHWDINTVSSMFQFSSEILNQGRNIMRTEKYNKSES